MGAIYIGISGWRYEPWRGVFDPSGLALPAHHRDQRFVPRAAAPRQLCGVVRGYEDESLERWAARIRAWAAGGDAYCYFDNDIKVRAPFDAKRLMEMVDATWP